MSEFEPLLGSPTMKPAAAGKPRQSDFIRELLRLNSEQVIAIKSGDQERIDLANHNLEMFLRMNHAGRLQEYFDARAEAARNDA